MKKKTRNRERIIIRKFDEVPIIDPLAYYSTSQILKLNLIPWMKEGCYDMNRLYWIMLYVIDWVRYPHEVTTKFKIKSINNSSLWNKSAKRKVKGCELIKFLQLNNALPK